MGSGSRAIRAEAANGSSDALFTKARMLELRAVNSLARRNLEVENRYEPINPSEVDVQAIFAHASRLRAEAEALEAKARAMQVASATSSTQPEHADSVINSLAMGSPPRVELEGWSQHIPYNAMLEAGPIPTTSGSQPELSTAVGLSSHVELANVLERAACYPMLRPGPISPNWQEPPSQSSRRLDPSRISQSSRDYPATGRNPRW